MPWNITWSILERFVQNHVTSPPYFFWAVMKSVKHCFRYIGVRMSSTVALREISEISLIIEMNKKLIARYPKKLIGTPKLEKPWLIKLQINQPMKELLTTTSTYFKWIKFLDVFFHSKMKISISLKNQKNTRLSFLPP